MIHSLRIFLETLLCDGTQDTDKMLVNFPKKVSFWSNSLVSIILVNFPRKSSFGAMGNAKIMQSYSHDLLSENIF